MLQQALTSQLRSSRHEKFLEQLRYTVVASQLLSDHSNVAGYNPQLTFQRSQSIASQPRGREEDYTISGLLATIGAAFSLVWSARWAGRAVYYHSNVWSITLSLSFLVSLSVGAYTLFRRQWRHYIRNQALETASSMVTNAQASDGATSAAITLIQEVELVSRGYKISSPLPPVSRFDDRGQTRRCARLRQALRSSLESLVLPHAEAARALQPLAVEGDLERYYDIYELSRADIEDVEAIKQEVEEVGDDPESLKSLKISLQKLHTARKMFLCCLLALDASGNEADFLNWKLATDIMGGLSSKYASAASRIDSILCEEGRFTMPPTPKSIATPSKDRVRSQLRKFASLSQGVRELQAKMLILREESDRTLDTSDEVAELGSDLLERYDAFGEDLRSLMQEWEEGRASLTANIGRNEKRISMSSNGMIFSHSPTPSGLSGLTALGGSPSDALKILNGDLISPALSTTSDEEVFEAVAMPRQRSTLTREERIAKMNEDRVRQVKTREKADANRHMLKELETVIKLRPSKEKTPGRVTTI